MRIVITGDTHGDLTLNRFHKIKNNFKDIDYVIVCGDFGYLFDRSVSEQDALKKMEEFPFKILWCDGNHENFELLKMYPVEDWNGGKITKINKNVYHLRRGEVFNLNNQKFFVFGGALSPDICMRQEFIDYWIEEIPSPSEMDYAICNLFKHKNKVDYIISHTCPTSVLKKILNGGHIFNDPTSAFLEYVKENTTYNKWFFGHMHIDKKITNKDISIYKEFCLLEI